MKRAWFGLILLALLLAAALGAQWAMDQIHLPISQALDQAAAQAVAGDWAGAQALSRQAEQRWEQTRFLRACLADHTPAEQVSAAFARLRAHAAVQDVSAFASAAQELAQMTQAMAKAHDLQWENLF